MLDIYVDRNISNSTVRGGEGNPLQFGEFFNFDNVIGYCLYPMNEYY